MEMSVAGRSRAAATACASTRPPAWARGTSSAGRGRLRASTSANACDSGVTGSLRERFPIAPGDSLGQTQPPEQAERRPAASEETSVPGAVRERLVLAAEDAAGTILGTVQVIFAQPENQPHRADLAKMLVHRSARRRGIGAALLAAAERSALGAGKTLLVLDTASGDAERLYAREGWERCGRIPDYALWPDGTPCATRIFFKL